MTRALVAVVLVALATPACGGAPRCELPTIPAADRGGAFLWKAQAPGGAVVWLFGTVHNGGEASIPAAAWAALDAAPRFASELGDAKPDPDALRDVMRLPPGKGLDQLLAASDWYDLRDALRGVVKEADLARARPWFAMSRLTAHVGQAPKPGMDDLLARRAAARGLAVDALETWDEQLGTLVDAVTIADLTAAIRARGTMRCELDQIRATYEAGDLAGMERILRPESADAMLLARNRRWLPAIEAYARGDGAFVAVGLGHLVGDGSLVRLLEQAGYRVERAP